MDNPDHDLLGPDFRRNGFSQGETSFLTVRILLGFSEAGFFPGMILYLTFWFPAAYRARVIAAFMLAIPVTGVIGGPLATSMLELNGRLAWQAGNGCS